MYLFKTFPAYQWLFIHFRKYWDLRLIVKKTVKIVKTTFNKFFRCIAHLGFNCSKSFVALQKSSWDVMLHPQSNLTVNLNKPDT